MIELLKVKKSHRFVKIVPLGPKFENIIGRVFYQTDKGIVLKGTGGPPQVKQKSSDEQKIREKIARRAAKEITNGWYVNLGIGLPHFYSFRNSNLNNCNMKESQQL